MSDNYIPEIGQALFGQPHKQYTVPPIMEAVLDKISEEYGRVYWNAMQQEYYTPLGNNGTQLITDVFEMHAYSWGDDEQPYNFKWNGLEISWYKRASRGLSANMEITPSFANKCLEDCLARIQKMEKPNCYDDTEYEHFIPMVGDKWEHRK
jgi:hypothetical protein